MSDIFENQTITQAGLNLAAMSTSSVPIIWLAALSSATVPQDPEDPSEYGGIRGTIDAAAAEGNVSRIVVGFTNDGQSAQAVKAIALVGKIAGQTDANAVIAAYCYDSGSQIMLPATELQRTRFAFNLIFNGTGNVTVYQTGNLTVADAKRFVSCHIPGDPEVGEDQTILGDKTWRGQQDFNEDCRFHDTISTRNVYPEGTATYSLGSSSYRWNAFYASSADITGNISSSGRVTCASALVTGSIRVDFVNARNKLALKASTFIGIDDEDNNKYRILMSGGAIDGVYGDLTILPQAQLTDTSTGTTYEQNVDIYIGAQDAKFQRIHVVGANVDYLFCKYWSNTGRQWRFGAIACGGDLIPNTNVVMGNTAVNLGASGTPWQNAYIDTVKVDTKVICPTNSIGQYTNGTLGDSGHYWNCLYTAYANIKNTLVLHYISSDTTGGESTQQKADAGSLCLAQSNAAGYQMMSNLNAVSNNGTLAEGVHVENLELSHKVYSQSLVTIPIGGLVMALPSQAWIEAHNTPTGTDESVTVLAGTTIVSDGSNAGIWYLACLHLDTSLGQTVYDGGEHPKNLPVGTYKALSSIRINNGQQTIYSLPVLLQRIS